MKKRQWLLLVICILLLAGYLKFFYKTWSNNAVARTADCVVALDVKKITNTLIWNFITSPSQWKKITFSSGDGIALDDMIDVPDYIFLFHNTNEPLNAWYTALTIKDKEKFEQGLTQFHFQKQDKNEYYSAETGLQLLINGDRVLVANAAITNKEFLQQTAAAIFSKQYIEKDQLQSIVNANSHAALQVLPIALNTYISAATINFNKDELKLDAEVVLPKGTTLPSYKFFYSDSSLCSLGFTQPQPGFQLLLDSGARATVSKLLNFNMDSLFLAANKNYQLDLEGFYTRTDSAVTYAYDDNFNAIEKKTVNTIEEPAFIFTVNGKAVNDVYRNWNNSGQLEHSATGALFTPVPFVKSYCNVKEPDVLIVKSNNYHPAEQHQSIEAIFFLHLLLDKIPASLTKFLPVSITKGLTNIKKLEAALVNGEGKIKLHATLSKKKNDQSLFNTDF